MDIFGIFIPKEYGIIFCNDIIPPIKSFNAKDILEIWRIRSVFLKLKFHLNFLEKLCMIM